MSASPRWVLVAFIVALPLHNLVMAELWDAGVRGFALDVVSAWKEVLLAAALALVVWRCARDPVQGDLAPTGSRSLTRRSSSSTR